MRITTDTYCRRPRAVLLDDDGAPVATSMIRPGETPRQALERLRDHWIAERDRAEKAAAKFTGLDYARNPQEAA